MRHLGEVGDQRLARCVFAEKQRDHHVLRRGFGCKLHEFLQADFFLLLVGHLDADGVLPRHGARRCGSSRPAARAAHRLRARWTADTLIPGAKLISYIVITGPVSISTTCASMPNSRSACSSTRLFRGRIVPAFRRSRIPLHPTDPNPASDIRPIPSAAEGGATLAAA